LRETKTQRTPRKRSRLSRYMRVLFVVIPALSMSAILLIGFSISRGIADDTAVRMSRQYAIETSANFQIFMNPHMRLMQQMAYSVSIARWLAGEDDMAQRADAFGAMMGHAATFPQAYFMFTFNELYRSYDFSPDLVFDNFVSWGYLVDGGTGRWFYNTLEAEMPFILNIQRTRPDEYGNFDLYIWSNHRIYYDGRVVGVVTIGSPFADIHNAAFYGFDIDGKRGYIIDQYGAVRMDSAGILETTVAGVPFPPAPPEAVYNQNLADEIANHLRRLQGGIFPLGTPSSDAIRLRIGEYRYASISPIVGTNWSIMVLSAGEGGLTLRYLPLIFATLLSFCAFVVVGGLLVRRIVIIPLNKLAQSTSQIGASSNVNIFGIGRDDEIGDIARSILQTLEAERDTRDFNQAILDAAPFVIGLWEEDGRPIAANAQTMDLFGIPDAKILTDNLYAFSPPFQPCGTPSPEKASMYYKKAFDEGYVRFEWLNMKMDGELLPVEVIYKTFRRKDKTILLSYTVDLREVKRLENERLEAVEEASRAKSRFLARMSHEIRTPLSAVLGISEIELRNSDLPPRIEAAFTKIYDSSKTLLHIVNDILDFSKIESGKMSLLLNEYHTEDLIGDVAQLHLVYAEQKNIDFKLYVDEEIPQKLKGDVMRLRQIIANLLTNAFKYTEAGAVFMSLYCDAKNDEWAWLVVCIEDTGMGMTAEQVAALKSDYMRFHETEKPFVGGTGLGIPIVYSLAHLMDAKLDIASEAGKGTKVVVRIPQETAGSAVLGQDLASSLQNFESKAISIRKDLEFVPEQMPYGRVLVVDDVETNLYVAEAMLESFGLVIELVDSGQAAIDKIAAGNVYDIIFLDQMMPGMDGLEAAKILRSMEYTHPIVALTANAIKGQAEIFMENGFSGFMTKPIDIKILNSYLLRFIKKQPAD